MDEVSSTLESLWSKARADNLETMVPFKCIDEYATSIQSNRRNLLIVLDDSYIPSPAHEYSMNGSLVYWLAKFDTDNWSSAKNGSLPFEWICSALDDQSRSYSVEVENLKEKVKKKEPWKVGQFCNDENCFLSDTPVKYCLSERAEPHCKLHFEPSIAIVVTILDFCKSQSRSLSGCGKCGKKRFKAERVLTLPIVKASLLFYIAFTVKDEPLMAMGDAVASFLDKEDIETRNMCLSSMADFRNEKGYKAGPRQYSSETYRWEHVISKRRRRVTFIM